MSKRRDPELLEDIVGSIDRIGIFTKNMDYPAFLRDIKTQDAVIRNLEIIGEAVKNISPNLKSQHKDIDWKNIAGMRDKIAHFYFGVNWDIVWPTIKSNLPILDKKLREILRNQKQ